MNVVSAARFAIPVLLLGGVIQPGKAIAQPAYQYGDVFVTAQMNDSTGYDRPYAVVFPRGQTRDGAVMWSCGEAPQGFAVAVRLGEDGAEGATRRLVWSLDESAPDTTVAQGVSGSRMWFVSDEDASALPDRLRGAARMSIRVLRSDTPQHAVEYTYTLAGADSATAQLACGGNTEDLAQALTAREALLQLSREPFVGRDGRLDGEPRPQEWWPQLLNVQEVARTMQRNYPPELMNAGVGGEVMLRFHVQQDGLVAPGSARVLDATDAGFVPAAVRVVEIMRFRPARRDGQVVGVWVTQPIHFRTAN
jgi:TonB family protein